MDSCFQALDFCLFHSDYQEKTFTQAGKIHNNIPKFLIGFSIRVTLFELTSSEQYGTPYLQWNVCAFISDKKMFFVWRLQDFNVFPRCQVAEV